MPATKTIDPATKVARYEILPMPEQREGHLFPPAPPGCNRRPSGGNLREGRGTQCRPEAVAGKPIAKTDIIRQQRVQVVGEVKPQPLRTAAQHDQVSKLRERPAIRAQAVQMDDWRHGIGPDGGGIEAQDSLCS